MYQVVNCDGSDSYWREQKCLSELISCAAWLAVNQYLAPTLAQKRRDAVNQHYASYVLMKAWPGLMYKQNQCKTGSLLSGLLQLAITKHQHTPHSETRPRHTRYGNSCNK